MGSECCTQTLANYTYSIHGPPVLPPQNLAQCTFRTCCEKWWSTTNQKLRRTANIENTRLRASGKAMFELRYCVREMYRAMLVGLKKTNDSLVVEERASTYVTLLLFVMLYDVQMKSGTLRRTTDWLTFNVQLTLRILPGRHTVRQIACKSLTQCSWNMSPCAGKRTWKM